MAIDSSPSQVATGALQAIPFASIIGGPLKAAIEAQSMAAKTSVDFINEVGLTVDPETKEKKTVNVSFHFIRAGRMAQLNVPLLTIVPIPYIAIQSITLDFKANISASSSSVAESSEDTDFGGEADIHTGLKVGPFHLDADIKANYSSKKDSKSSQESKYSVEYTMDVSLQAGQESMPGGMAKVLEILNNAVSVSDPDGSLSVNASSLLLENGQAILVVTYQNADGLFKPEEISLAAAGGGDVPTPTTDGDSVVFLLTKADTYTVSVADSKRTQTVTVTDPAPAPTPTPVPAPAPNNRLTVDKAASVSVPPVKVAS
jgi:hypothetical protein